MTAIDLGMIERLENVGGGRFEDLLAVWVPNGIVVAAINLATLNHLATFLLASVTMGYTIWRWRRDSFVACEGCRQGKIPDLCPIPARKRPWWCPKRI